MAKTINRTVITKVYRVKVIDKDSYDMREIDVECRDIKEKDVIKEIKKYITDTEIVVNRQFISQKKVTYTMPASKFYDEATVKE